jgi:tripartite-type tricarboxylate transporter receptor subunit TctC
MLKALAGADVRERMAAQGAEVVGGTPGELAAALKEDLVKWARVVKAARVTID